MIRSAASKVMWVGRATVFLVGLAVILGLVFGLASSAFGANGGNFILGVLTNKATDTTRLSGNISGGPALQIINGRTESGSRALQLNVADGKPPLSVNSGAGKAINLNADKVDSYNSTALLPGGDLPPGRTVRGNFEIDGYAGYAGLVVGADSISFGYRLASLPTVEFVRKGAASTTNCPGTASSPEAAKGYLCIYESFKNNTTPNSPDYINLTRVGVGLRVGSASAGHVSAYGTWAVTGNDSRTITPL